MTRAGLGSWRCRKARNRSAACSGRSAPSQQAVGAEDAADPMVGRIESDDRRGGAESGGTPHADRAGGRWVRALGARRHRELPRRARSGLRAARISRGPLGGKWPRAGLEFLVAAAPQVLVDLTMGYEATGDRTRWGRFRELPAVKDGRVYFDASQVFLRPGPRLGEQARLLSRFLHPEAWRDTTDHSKPD